MIIDIILLIIFIIAAIWGANKGGVKIIAGLLSFVLSFALAYALAGTVGEYIRNTGFGQTIEHAIENRMVSSKTDGTEILIHEDSTKKQENSTPGQNEFDIIAKIEEMVSDKVDETIHNSKEVIGQKVVQYVFVAIGFLVTFIGVKLVLWIVCIIVEWLFKLPLLKALNKQTGCILEVVLMLLKIWIVLGVISFISPLDFMSTPMAMINGSTFTKFLFENNLLVSLIIGKII